MTEKKPRIGKKGGAQRVAEEFSKIRKEPLPKEVFSIVEDNYKKISKSQIKSPPSRQVIWKPNVFDLGV
jgi:hypothetical protein